MAAAVAAGTRVVHALCSVVFDIHVGQKLEHCYPEGALSEEEARDMAFHAFPDSMSMELHARSAVRDTSFHFRIPRRGNGGAAGSFLYGFVFCRQRFDESLRRGGEQKSVVVLSSFPLSCILAPLASYAAPLAFSYGPGALEQVFEEVGRWPDMEWGAQMVLPLGMAAITADLPELSLLPPGCAQDAAAVAAADEVDLEGLETPPSSNGSGAETAADGGEGAAYTAAPSAAAAADADAAAAGRALLAEELDPDSGLPLSLLPQSYGQQALCVGVYADCDVYSPLRAVLPQLWTLWEILLLGQPLLVAAPTPGACSGAAAALLSLLAPFPYCCDFRPYFTIHDPAFAPMASGALPDEANGLPCLLGITNLYFLKALPHWPNVLSTGYTPATQPPSHASGAGGVGEHSSALPHSASLPAMSQASSNGGAGAGGGGSRLGGMLRRGGGGPAALLSNAVDAAWLGYKPACRPDRQVLDSLVHPLATDPLEKRRRLGALNSGILRRHFQELTRALLFPLLPYISPTPSPLGGQVRAAELREPPPLPELPGAALLEAVADPQCVVPDILRQRFGSGAQLAAFFERLLASPNLRAWLARQRGAAEAWQRAAWRAAWQAAGGALADARGLQHLDEVAAVESFMNLEHQLAAVVGERGGEQQRGDALAERLRRQLHMLLAVMQPDLQRSLLLSPERAELLQMEAPPE